MIIPKKNQKVEKRKKFFLFDARRNNNFELKDFIKARVKNFSHKSQKISKFRNFIKRLKSYFHFFLLSLIRFRIRNINYYECRYYCINIKKKFLDINRMEFNYKFIFKINSLIFIFILRFYLNVFSYYGSYIFLNKLNLPKDYFIETFLYYSDQDVGKINNYLFESNISSKPTDLKPFILKVFDHKINPGETLSHVAAKYNITSETLISFNEIKDARSIKPGSVIKVPNMKGIIYSVKKNDSLSSISDAHNVSKVDILDANNLENEVLFLDQKLFLPGGHLPKNLLKEVLGETFLYPVQGGTVTSWYGYRPDPFTKVISFHNGIDIANSFNTPVRVAKEGIVLTLGFNAGGYGRYIIVSHNNGLQTLYAHLNSFAVKIGKKLYRGEIIGYMGSTGHSTGNHLHFTILKNGKTENPMKYLR